jgi:transcriptional regulator of nitric oxide reductase
MGIARGSARGGVFGRVLLQQWGSISLVRSSPQTKITAMELSAKGADQLQVVALSDTKLDAIARVNVTRGHSVGAKRYFDASLLCFYRGFGTQVRPVNFDVSINRVTLYCLLCRGGGPRTSKKEVGEDPHNPPCYQPE